MTTLAEELLLLALRDEQGAVPGGAQLALKYGLSGAILADLLLQGRLSLDEKQRVGLIDGSPTSDQLLDQALEKIASRKRLRSLKDWVLSLGQGALKDAQKELVSRLVARGILREEEGRFLWLFPTHRYPEQDAAPEQDVRARLRAVALYGATPDERTLVLLSLVKACRLLNEVFTGEEREAARKRSEELTRSEVAGAAVGRAVQTVEAAVMTAVIASTAASAAASSSS